MKFVVSSTLLLEHLQAISRTNKFENSKYDYDFSFQEMSLIVLSNQHFKKHHSHFLNLSKSNKFNKSFYDDLNIFFKIKNKSNKDLFLSRFEKEKENPYKNLSISAISILEDVDFEDIDFKKFRQTYIQSFYVGSVKELMRRLALYTGQVLSTLFRVLRNTRIHSLSIFFGLCCSCSGYIFKAITGTSSHPVPASL